jgi:hypothetical protein
MVSPWCRASAVRSTRIRPKSSAPYSSCSPKAGPRAPLPSIITNTTRKALEDAKERLEKAQACLDQALSVDETAVKGKVAAIPRAIGKYRNALDRIEDTLSTRLEPSRELLRDLLGEISLRPNGHALEARMRLDWASTLNQCEAPETAKLKVMMVAEESLYSSCQARSRRPQDLCKIKGFSCKVFTVVRPDLPEISPKGGIEVGIEKPPKNGVW